MELFTKSDHAAVAEGCYFDPDAADRAVRFIETYTVPKLHRKPITLLPWQRSYVERLYGWKDKSGRRRHRKATLSTAKKNGKTVLQAGILLYELFGGVQPDPFCVSASTTRENASQIWAELDHAISFSDRLSRPGFVKSLESYKEIRCRSKHAKYKAFSADAGSAEGENISALVVDELHAHVSDKLFRSLEFSTVSRPDGLVLVISTAGHDQSSLWFDQFKYAKAVQSGDIIDTALLPLIYTTGEDADLDDPATWYASNPSLGHTGFSEDDFRKALERAKAGGTADLLSFRRYRLNQWCHAENAFIDPAKYDACLAAMTDDQLKPFPLYASCDLSQTTDPCSVGMFWALGDRKFYMRGHAWVCEEGVKKRVDKANLPQYRVFQADGHMTITPGERNDYRKIKAYILDLRKRFNLKEVIFDQYNALEMCEELTAEGITVYRHPQNHAAYTAPMKSFEVALNEQRIHHDGNKLLRWALQNTIVDMDAAGNCKPDRKNSTDKIDPAIAALMAYSRAEYASVTSLRKSVYEGRGLTVI